MKKIKSISGFPEWLPEQRLIEQEILKTIQQKFELFGFTPIETRAVELLEQLLAKGETDKEIYTLHRLQAVSDENAEDAEFGLHFDLTVPLARYVMQHRGKLNFPFKRYQIQKVWRGERPQEGRYREFYQADIDVIAENELPLHFDAEMPWLLYEIMQALPFPEIRILINNRKILEGFYRGLGINDITSVLRAVDKLDKIGEEGVLSILVDQLEVEPDNAKKCLELGRIHSSDCSFVERVKEFGVQNELLDEGLNELAFVMESLSSLPEGSIVADLHIARGLDYYTGTVYEGYLVNHENLGAVCSGGRYDDLASSDGKNKLPGVGVSIGITRILGYLFSNSMLAINRKTPTCVLVTLPDDTQRMAANEVVRTLRQRGIPAELFHKPIKFGKQIRHAERFGIPYVWFLSVENTESHEIRDIRSGEQYPANADKWEPPEHDLKLNITLNEIK